MRRGATGLTKSEQRNADPETRGPRRSTAATSEPGLGSESPPRQSPRAPRGRVPGSLGLSLRPATSAPAKPCSGIDLSDRWCHAIAGAKHSVHCAGASIAGAKHSVQSTVFEVGAPRFISFSSGFPRLDLGLRDRAGRDLRVLSQSFWAWRGRVVNRPRGSGRGAEELEALRHGGVGPRSRARVPLGEVMRRR